MTAPHRQGTKGRAPRRPSSFSPVSAVVFTFFVALVLAALPALAEAKTKGKKHKSEGGSKRIAITSNDGGGAPEGPVRTQLAKALKKSKVKVVSHKKGAAPTDDQQWVALGQKLKVDGFLQLSFEAGHGKRSVEITVRTGSDGSALASETFTAKGTPAKLGAAVAKNFWKKLGDKVMQTSAATASETTGMPARDLAHEEAATPAASPVATAEPEIPAAPVVAAPQAAEPVVAEVKPAETTGETAKSSEPAAKPPAPAAPAASETGKGLGPREPTLSAVVQVRYLHRSFVYTPAAAAPTASVGTPTIGAEVAWFPLANFGLAVGGEAESWAKELNQYPTLSSDLHASLVFRLALSFGELYLRAGGFRQFFAISDDSSHTRLDFSAPDVVYTGGRAGGALTVPLTDALSLTVSADYRLVTSLVGGGYPLKSQSYFPNAEQGPAFDGALTLAYRITPMLEIQAGGDIRRYVMALGGKNGDRINASGATDLYLSGWIGLGGAYGGR